MTKKTGASASRIGWPSGRCAFACLDEKAHGQEVSRPARTEPTCDEARVHGLGALAPVAPADAAIVKEAAGGATGKAKARRATPVQQVGVLKRGDQGETGLHASRFGVAGRQHGALRKAGRPIS